MPCFLEYFFAGNTGAVLAEENLLGLTQRGDRRILGYKSKE